MMQAPIVVGRVNGLFGVKGWVKVYSYTRPAENLLAFNEWQLGCHENWRSFRVLDARSQRKTLVARLGNANGEPLTDRDDAAELLDLDIAVTRDDLPVLEPGRYYWVDLVGLDVVNREGHAFGQVRTIMETGANDVLVVRGERERLIPFVVGEHVDTVDLEAARILVDWDRDF